MIQASIAVLTICVLAGMSFWANRRFKNENRLPMQFSLSGSVNWTAPRAVALAFTPVLAAIILLATAALTTFLQPRPGQAALVIPTNIFLALVFVGAHALHLRLIENTHRRNR